MVVNAAYYIHMKLWWWRALLKTMIQDLGFVGGINIRFSWVSNMALFCCVSIAHLIWFNFFKSLKGLKYCCYISVDVSALQPKLMATCQSSVELIGHLSAMLISESHVSEECARASEVRELTARYDHLVSRARAREQRIRESKWVILSVFVYIPMLVLVYTLHLPEYQLILMVKS
jgi:hypothetical protein